MRQETYNQALYINSLVKPTLFIKSPSSVCDMDSDDLDVPLSLQQLSTLSSGSNSPTSYHPQARFNQPQNTDVDITGSHHLDDPGLDHTQLCHLIVNMSAKIDALAHNVSRMEHRLVAVEKWMKTISIATQDK